MGMVFEMPLVVVYTAHALFKMKERHIERDGVERTIRDPEASEVDPNQLTGWRFYRRIPEYGNRVLRVVFIGESTAARVVTVLFDRRKKL